MVTALLHAVALSGWVVIRLRYTILEGEDQIIFVPNANLVTNPVIVTKRE